MLVLGGRSLTFQIKNITLYKSGIGFFIGKCSKKEFILPINENDVDDILKSLSVDGLKSVTFSASEGKDSIKRKIGMDIDVESAFISFSKHLVGLTVEIETDKIHRGKVLGIDFLLIDDLDDEESGVDVLIIQEKNTVQHLPISRIKRIKILNETIQKDLEVFLELEASTRKAGVTNLTVISTKEDASIQWVAPVSAWRLSYRVQYSQEKNSTDFTGIAIVDNTTGIDWEKIKLLLVTGRPVSFRYDLHSPHYVDRPWISREETGISPLLAQAAVRRSDARKKSDQYGRGHSEPSPKALTTSGLSLEGRLGWDISRDVMKTVSVASQEELAATVTYQVTKPVTINRSESSLIPLFNKSMKGELCVVIRDDRIEDGMDAILFSKDLDLEKGVATVHIDDIFAGDAMIVRGTDYIAFRINQDISTISSVEQTSKTLSVSVKKNLLYQKFSKIATYNFKFLNIADKKISIVLEIGKLEEYKPKTKPIKETANYYRYKFDLEPGSSEKIFTFTKIHLKSLYVRDLSEDVVNDMIKDGILDDKNERLVLKIFANLRKITQKENELVAIESEIDWEYTNQERLRENIIVLQKILQATERDSYIERLKDSEKHLEGLESEKKELTADIKKLRTKI